MKESDLYIPVRDWLVARGYEVHVEVFGVDIIALKDGFLTVVELKKWFNQHLRHQMQHAANWADFVMGAVPGKRGDKPKHVGYLYGGFGLLFVDGAKVHQFRKPKRQPMFWHRGHDYRMDKLKGRLPAQDFETAGIPSCPALSEQREKRKQLTND